MMNPWVLGMLLVIIFMSGFLCGCRLAGWYFRTHFVISLHPRKDVGMEHRGEP